MSKARNLARLVVDSGGAVDAANLTNAVPADGSITAAKLAIGAAVSNIGFTPANKAGDTFTGNVNISGAVVATGNVTAYGTV